VDHRDPGRPAAHPTRGRAATTPRWGNRRDLEGGRPPGQPTRRPSPHPAPQECDPGTLSCRPARAGAPVANGAEWLNVSTFRGRRTELRYRLVRLEDRRLTFVGRNRTATSTDDLTIHEENGVTLLTYRARIDFHGPARLASPFLRGEFERLGDEMAHRMPQAVNSHLGPGGGIDWLIQPQRELSPCWRSVGGARSRAFRRSGGPCR
jgi:hypothetical protein